MPEPHSAANGRLRLSDRQGVREIRLHRPEVHNALDEELIAGLTGIFLDLQRETASVTSAPRAVLLSAEGKSFCAGADLNYMARVAGFTEEENLADARRLSAMFRAVHDCPVFVLGRIQGAALGGGAGLAACCDFALASEDARFGFTEVRLGIVPAVISPFVLERIGTAGGRAWFPSGEIFSAAEAARIGLVDRVAPASDLDTAVNSLLQTLRLAAPGASREAKTLARRMGARANGEVPAGHPEDRHEEAARWIARMRALPEGREGMAAFLEKRKAGWSQ